MFKLIEHINLTKLDELIQLSFIDDKDIKTLKHYRKLFKDKDFIEITYTKKFKNYGRYYGSILQNIDKKFRNYICYDYCIDLDIINCHPTILNQLLIQYDIASKELQSYVDNRSYILQTYNIPKDYISFCINNSNFSSSEPFFNKINKRIYDDLFHKLKKIYPDLFTYISKQKDYNENIEGSFISWVLQTIESDIIDQVIKYLKQHNIKISTYMYDGLLLLKNEQLNDNFLSNLSSFIKEKTYYNILFSFKKMDFDDLLKSISYEKENYIKWKTDFEKNHFYILHPKQGFCMKYNDTFEIYSRNQLTEWYNKSNMNMNYLNNWFDDKHALTFHHYDFIPPPLFCPPDVYNIWNGFKISHINYEYDQTLKSNVLSLFRSFISHLNSNDKDATEFMIKHYAHIIQYPGQKNGICYVISGIQGSGKGTNDSFLRSIIGNYHIQITNPEHALGRFNDIFLGKISITFDETSSIELVKNNGILKTIITEPNLSIEEKGKKTFSSTSCCRIFINTNDQNPVKISDGERRMVILDPPKMTSELANAINNGPFSFIIQDINNSTELKLRNLRIIFDYLSTLNIEYNDMFSWQNNRPITKKYKEVSEHYSKIEHYWIYHFSEEHNDEFNNANDIYQHYSALLDENKNKFKLGTKEFYQFLRTIPNQYKRTSTSRQYKFNFDEIKHFLEHNHLYTNYEPS